MSELTVTDPVEITVRPKDKLFILVNAQDPKLTNMFNLPIMSQQLGMANSNLHVFPIGKVPPNPTELLENGRLEGLIAQVRGEFDYVFIDCPPIDIVADAQILEKAADRTLFVIRAGLLDRSMLPELEKIYNEKRFKNLSVILNGTESAGGRYGYRYGYGHGSYYNSK